MSNSKMLIDATHPEETRVVVQRGGRVEEFDFESAARKLLRGNIYLAKVTRVEPSLQAAFVDYGGNRHGFLAFNEIHPDYYQIPVADRQALIDEEAAAEAELEAAADRRAEALERRAKHREHGRPASSAGDTVSGEEAMGEADEISNIVDVEEDEHIEEIGGENGEDDAPRTFAAAIPDNNAIISEPLADLSHGEPAGGVTEDGHAEPDQSEDDEDESDDHESDNAEDEPSNFTDGIPESEAASAEPRGTAQGGDLLEEVPVRPRRRPRSYKIQEVIKRRQIILVQVVKEERGNKGAALTTYLSLAGRYTVLMPNTARGGGISRKITNPQDRKRLKAIAQELDVPEGMGLIIRTAGAARTKQEIKRDFEYLLRLWESVRDLTLQSTAPSLVYEEGDLIKRSIRDLYNKDVEEVVVAGDAGYQEAADFMQMLLPSHSKHVVKYSEPTPLFARYGVERQLNAMFSPQVTLRSGGYIVINQTEALVAIDVNSGKSTREFSIEETALATNLEAADEIARQLKLRDLAGLIVIDFIDMEEKRNNRAVERRLKDALRHDRARIQLGRISHFGLMEMSRQRLRTGVLEGSTSQCSHCQGTGIIRSTESVALAVLRGLEDAITAGANAPLIATTTSAVALYILNSKRSYISDMEARHGFSITVLGSDRIHGANFTIERGLATVQAARRPERAAVNMDWGFEGEGDEEAPAFDGGIIEQVAEDDDVPSSGRERHSSGGDRSDRGEGDEDGNRRGGRRRRRRRGGRRGDRGGEDRPRNHDQALEAREPNDDDGAGYVQDAAPGDLGDDADEGDSVEVRGDRGAGGEDAAGEPRRRRRRGRRGGRRGRERDGSDRPSASAGAGENNFTESVAGFEPQPEVDFAQRDQAPGQEQARPAEGHSERRRRHERIWDTPASNSNESTQPAEARPVSDHVHNGPQKAVATEDTSKDVSAPRIDPDAIRRRQEQAPSEPRLERIVVRPGQSEGEGADAAPPPSRKGWWQRKLMSD